MLFEKAVINKYKKRILARRDADGTQRYLSPSDLPGLGWDDIDFTGDRGQRLYGHIYYRGAKRSDTLLVFDHGMGCGHVAYMKEIDLLTERGFTVATYDQTGTRSSEGEDIGCMAQSLADLECFIGALKNTELGNTEIAVIGHSWGGFSAMNIPALCPEVKKVVAISGFVSTHQVLEDALTGFLKLYRRAILKAEDAVIPRLNGISSVESLKNSGASALIIHSRDDSTVRFETSYTVLKEALEAGGRVEFLAENKKLHHPTYTREAVRYRDEFSKERKRLKKRGLLNTPEQKAAFVASYDFDRMTEQDSLVWDRIVEFLNR